MARVSAAHRAVQSKPNRSPKMAGPWAKTVWLHTKPAKSERVAVDNSHVAAMRLWD